MLVNKRHKNEEELEFDSFPKGFLRLFAKPGSEAWKGAALIRKQLTKCLMYLGYSARQYGKGEAVSRSVRI